MPAEWARQESVWMTWPRDEVTWPDRIEKARAVYLEVLRLVTPHQRVDLVVHPDLRRDVEARLAKAGLRNVALHAVEHQDSWIRDYGPIYVTRTQRGGAGAGGTAAAGAAAGAPERLATKWRFNAWGEKYESLLFDDGVVGRLGARVAAPALVQDMVLEGGSIDVNGAGTLLTTEQCLLNVNRNPHLLRGVIESRLCAALGVSKVLWLGEGIVGDDTDGHIDDIARFVGPRTVVAAVEPDASHPNHKPLDENLHRLRGMKDQDGRALDVVELPMPPDVLDDEGQPLPASHANFLVTNGVVLVPGFGGASDASAKRVLERCFPERAVAVLDCRDLVWGMGTLHCLSQQMPVGVPAQWPPGRRA